MKVLDLIILSRDYIENQEGEVITFEDNQMAKVKNLHYLSLHGLIGPDAFRENLLVKTILDENIDDVISALVPGEKRTRIETLTEKVQHHFDHLVVEFKSLRGEYFNKYNENRKEFALQYSPSGKKPHELFSAVMRTLKGTSFKDVEKIAEAQVKEHILNRTNSLGNAKDYIGAL